jgi:hypothetical protein
MPQVTSGLGLRNNSRIARLRARSGIWQSSLYDRFQKAEIAHPTTEIRSQADAVSAGTECQCKVLDDLQQHGQE